MLLHLPSGPFYNLFQVGGVVLGLGHTNDLFVVTGANEPSQTECELLLPMGFNAVLGIFFPACRVLHDLPEVRSGVNHQAKPGEMLRQLGQVKRDTPDNFFRLEVSQLCVSGVLGHFV